MDITYLGPSSADVFDQAFYDSVDDEFELVITTNTPTQVVGYNPATNWEVTFTGTGLNADPLAGTVTGMTIRDDDGNTIITFTNFAWATTDLIPALIDLIELDDSTALDALLDSGEVNFDGSGAVDGFDLVLDTLTTHIDAIGTPFNDTLEGGSGNDDLAGGDGNDSILGNGGRDTLRGNAGDDFINGGGGNDSIIGGLGNDRLEGGGGDDTIVSGSNDGNEVVVPGSGNDSVLFSGITQGSFDYVTLGHWDLSAGVTVTIDGNANTATVDKGVNGTTTITDIRNPMLADGLGVWGSGFDDTFNITVVDGGWMQVNGSAGTDSYQINASNGS
ncbi:calcium-binding protein, partial [Marimonas arenosa]